MGKKKETLKEFLMDEVKFWKNSAEFWRAKYERELRKHPEPFITPTSIDFRCGYEILDTVSGINRCEKKVGHPGKHSFSDVSRW